MINKYNNNIVLPISQYSIYPTHDKLILVRLATFYLPWLNGYGVAQ